MSQLPMDDLYRRWHKPVRSWVRRCSVPMPWVEDVTQEVFLRLIKYKPATPENMAGYIFRTASNVAHEWLARSCFAKTHVEFDDLGDGVLGIADPPETGIEKQEFQTALEIGISKLQGRRLLVVMLRMYEEKTYKEIAEELGLTQRIILRDIVLAYRQLRIELKHLAVEGSIDERATDDYRKGSSRKASSALSGVRTAETHVGTVDRIHDDGAPLDHFLGGTGDQRPVAGSQAG